MTLVHRRAVDLVRREQRRRADPLPDAWAANWRVFFLACAELWGYHGGRDWLVSHYRFAPRPLT